MDKVDTSISDWVMDEIKNLRSENEKLRKVAEASEAALPDMDHMYRTTVELEDALKEWKGENAG